MIKNLITATLLSTTLAVQQPRTIESKNEYTSTTNTYIETQYNDEVLITEQRYKILEFSYALLGSSANIQARAIQYYYRSIENETAQTVNEYTIQQKTLIKVNPNALTYVNNQISFTLPFDQSTLDSKIIRVYEIERPTIEQIRFLDEENYQNYSEMNVLFADVSANRENSADLSPVNGVYSYTITPTTEILELDTEFYFDTTKITDMGLSLYTFVPFSQINNVFTFIPPDPGQVTYEVVDLPGLMFSILGMPFAWLSTAFNFTIFEGTPYAINISAILMAIVVSLIALYIIKRILK